MSKFASGDINGIAPYVPGEQPQDKKYIKLNTNENAYFTSERAVKSISEAVLKNLNRYSDPESKTLVKTIASYYGVEVDNVLVTNGSDEALAFCSLAYARGGVCYADVTYGFYDVIAKLYGCPVEHIPLNEDYLIEIEKYYAKHKTIILANPNAQTGIALPNADIEKIILSNKNNIVVVDQAYVDFFGENAIPLIKKYENLIVVNTFSKSRSLAGARVGYIIANSKLIDDLKAIKNSFHPYNVNTVSALLAKNAMDDDEYFKLTVGKIIDSRTRLSVGLAGLGFKVLPSSANFVLARTDKINGRDLYLMLKGKGILVRHFSDKRIEDFIRITVGTDDEITFLLSALSELLEN